MPSKGVFSAYQRLKPIKEDFSDNILQDEKLNATLRKEQDAAKGKARARSEKLAKEVGISLSALNEVISGVKSIDQANALGVSKARDFMYKTYKDIERDPRKAGNVEYQLKLANARKFSSKLSQAQKTYAEFAEDFTKGYGDGKYSKWNQGRMKQLSAVFEKNDFTVDIDKSGNPVAIVKAGEGEFERINLVDILDGKGLGDVVNTYDFETGTTEMADSLGERLTLSSQGSYTVEEQSFEPHRKQISELADGILGADGVPSDVAKSIWSDTLNKNKADFTGSKKDLAEVKNAFLDSVESKYDTLYKKKFDAARVNAGLRSRELKQKTKKGLATLEIKTDTTTGKPLRDGLTGASGDIGGGAVSFSLGTPVSFGVGNKEKKISTVYLTDAGKIAYEGEERTGTESISDPLDHTKKISRPIYKRVEGGGLDQKEINNLARRILNKDTGEPFKNASELRKHLEQKKGKLPTTKSENKQKDLRTKYNY